MQIKDRVFVITGASSGIGLGLAKRVASLGANVVLADVNEAAGRAVESNLNQQYGAKRTIFIKCDVTKRQDLENALTTAKRVYGGFDVMVNNAGLAGKKAFVVEDDWKLMVDVNFTAVIEGSQLAIQEWFKTGRGGLIINTASQAAIWPMHSSPVYAATKSGVFHFTRSCGGLHKLYNIRVNAVCPYFTDTGMTKDIKSEQIQNTIMTVDHVVEAFIQIIENDQLAGACLGVTPAGIRIENALEKDKKAIAAQLEYSEDPQPQNVTAKL